MRMDISNSSHCLFHQKAIEFWCLNVGGPPHGDRILLPTPLYWINRIDLRDFKLPDSAFHIFHQWTLDFRLPIFKPRQNRWIPEALSFEMNDEVSAFEAYFLGWRLGAVVFTNQLMNAIAKMYDENQALHPPFCVLRRAFTLLNIRNPMCKFLIHAWSSKEWPARYLEHATGGTPWTKIPKGFERNLSERLQTIEDLMAPDTFTANICQYHTHFSKGSDLRESWVRYLNDLERRA
ncbi:hypothetical protein IWX91DRAFT_320033 [Phyllosticta citricarpa]